MNKTSFIAGAKKAVPIMLGYTPLGLAFGVVAREAGLDVWQTALMSLTAYTGSGQFIAVGMLGAGASLSAIFLTTCLVNSRYLLFSAAMAPYVKKLPSFMQSLLAFGITDETFVVNMTEFREGEADASFILGVNMASHFAWVANSAIGAAIGNIFSNIDKFGTGFALPAMFIALLITQIENKLYLWVALISGGFSLIISLIMQNNSNIIIATIISATIGVFLCPSRQKSTS